MAVKTSFAKVELAQILQKYALGQFVEAVPFAGGAVQTNLRLQTTLAKFAFRYYENRSMESVLFEANLIRYLKARNYPCAAPIVDKHGKLVNQYNGKPYVIFEFVSGEHIENPNSTQKEQLIQKVAELQNLTKNYRPAYKNARWNYSRELCRQLAAHTANNLNTPQAYEKLNWHESQLAVLELPLTLPKGICHCDFHFSNVLFANDEFAALLDFDDANYTYLLFDLVGLIETEAWHYAEDEVIDFGRAKTVVYAYARHRPLSRLEKQHLFDVYKLSILFDCIWYFARGNADDFYEKRKIDYLNDLGRANFYTQLFG
jgi:homoserine kinase type II